MGRVPSPCDASAILETKVSQKRKLIRPAAQCPAELPFRFFDDQVINARSPRHQALFVEFPILVPVGSKPVSVVVVPLICKSNSDPVTVPGPQFFDQTLVELLFPFAS